LTGVGTGDNFDKLTEYIEQNPNQESFNTADPHNYYAFIMVQFGILGFAVLIFFLVYPAIKQNLWTKPVFISLFVITIAAMCVESLFNIFSTMMLYCLMMSILLFNKDEF